MRLLKPKLFVGVFLALLTTSIAALPAAAREIERSGKCSGDSYYSADMELEYRVWDFSFDIDTRAADQNWRFELKQNGRSVYTNTRSTIRDYDDSYAEVEWDLIRPDRSGRDRFQFVAKNQVTGEVCRVTLRQ